MPSNPLAVAGAAYYDDAEDDDLSGSQSFGFFEYLYGIDGNSCFHINARLRIALSAKRLSQRMPVMTQICCPHQADAVCSSWGLGDHMCRHLTKPSAVADAAYYDDAEDDEHLCGAIVRYIFRNRCFGVKTHAQIA